MTLSNKKYADPKEVIDNIVDDNFKKAFEGEQEDIMEFNAKFIECLQEGLYHKLKIDLKKKEQTQLEAFKEQEKSKSQVPKQDETSSLLVAGNDEEEESKEELPKMMASISM
jgi:hypothetical protein